MIGCGNEIYYLDSYNYSDLGEPSYETKQLNSSTLNDASVEAYGIIADEIISVYSRAIALDENLGGVDNEIKASEKSGAFLLPAISVWSLGVESLY